MPAPKKIATRVASNTTSPSLDLQFQIQQLRLDKLIYASEAVAVCFGVFLLLLSLPLLYSKWPGLPEDTPWAFLIIGVGSALWALIGNLFRFKKIRRLERELEQPA